MDIRSIKQKLTIYDVLEHFGKLPRDGSGRRPHTHSIPCPFHEDRNPSFRIYVENQSFTCFGGCGAGDVLSLIGLSLGTEDFPSIAATAEAITISRYGADVLKALLNPKSGHQSPRGRTTGADGATECIEGTTERDWLRSPLRMWRHNAQRAQLRFERMLARGKKRPKAKQQATQQVEGQGERGRPSRIRHSCTCGHRRPLYAFLCASNGVPPTLYDIKLITKEMVAITMAAERRVHRDVRRAVSLSGDHEAALRLFKAYELLAMGLMLKKISSRTLATRLMGLAEQLRERAQKDAGQRSTP